MLQRCTASDGMGKLGEESILWGGKMKGDGNAGLCLFFFFCYFFGFPLVCEFLLWWLNAGFQDTLKVEG